MLVGYCLRALHGGSNQEDLCRPFWELPCTRIPDGVWCFPLASEMCAECSLFWFPRRVCLSEVLALPPTGFGCRELFIRSVSFWFSWCLRHRGPAAPGPSPTGAQRPYTVSSWARDVGRVGQCWWSLPLCSLRSVHLTRR